MDMNNKENENYAPREYKEKKIGNLEMIRFDGQVLMFRGLEQYVLEQDLFKALQMPDRVALNNEYNRAARKGIFCDNEDRIELNADQNKQARAMLHMDFRGKRLKAVKYVKALSIIANSESKYKDQALLQLTNIAEVGNRALRYQKMRNEGKVKFSEKDFFENINKKVFLKSEYNQLKMNALAECTPIDKEVWTYAKEKKAINNRHSCTYSIEETKRNNELSINRIKQWLRYGLDILEDSSPDLLE